MGSKLIKISMVASLAMLSSVTFAVPIYDINRVIEDGSVVGTLETDGTIGVLQEANIIDWDLNITDGLTSFNLLPTNSSWQISGSDFSASATSINYNFSSMVSSFALLQNPAPGSGVNAWCLSSNSQPCGGFSNEVVGLTGTTDGSQQGVDLTGNLSVGTTGSVSQVPEPTALALFGIGLFAAGAAKRKRG